MAKDEMDWAVDTKLKADVATEMLKGELPIEEICKKYSVTREQAVTWAETVNKSIYGDPDACEEVG